MTFDEVTAIIAEYVERRKTHEGKKVDNSSLIAGSPMYYYCWHCSAPTDVLPELHSQIPRKSCPGCDVLVANELLGEAEKAFEVEK